MSFLRKMKPHSTAEWLLLVLLVVMVVATAALLITQPFLNNQEDVHLRAIESSRESETPSDLLMATEEQVTDQAEDTSGQKIQALTDHMKLIASYNKDFVTKQVNPILRNLRTAQNEEPTVAETLPLPGGLSVPDTNDQAWVTEAPSEAAPSETQPAYTGPTSPPPLDPNASQNQDQPTGETSPPPLAPSSEPQNQVPRETSPPPLSQSNNTQVTSPPPLDQPGNNQAGSPPASNQVPGQTSPPPGSVSAQATSPAAQAGQSGSTVMPGPEKIAQVQGGVVQMINAARAQAGLGQLSNPGVMQTISAQRAGELSVRYHAAPNTHYRPDGSNALVYIANTYGGQYAMGECVAWFDNVSRLSAEMIFEAFMNSPPHRAIIMNAGVGSIGVGVYCVPGPVPDNNTGEPNDSLVGRFFVSLNFGS